MRYLIEADFTMIDSSKCMEIMKTLPRKSVRKSFLSLYERRIVELDKELRIYAFLGKEHDYIMIPYIYCSCLDYLIRVLGKRERKFCYHLLSLCLAINNDMTVKLREKEESAIYIAINEIMTSSRSKTLRQLRR